MKKNISINISGIIFHIEEDGYDTLKKYLDSINKYFSTFEDSSEILADIESRIAEIFLSKLNEEKQIITAEDVNALVSTMGSVSDFKAAEEQETAANENPSAKGAENFANQSSGTSSANDPYGFSPKFEPSRKLMRDQKRKTLGGVCAGLGNYFNIDPLWIKLLFALFFFAYGITFIIYIIMWIVVPGSYELDEPVTGKKMFRDPERKVIGGVSGGVAAFLGIDIVAIRVIFIILAVAGGLGLFIYIVLWLILPEARSLTDKMQMQGEPVTLSNIESTIKKTQTDRATDDESAFTKILLFPFRLIGIILTALGKVLVPILDIIRVAIGILIVLTGMSLVFSIIVTAGILFGVFSATTFSFPWLTEFSEASPLEAMSRAFPAWTAVAGFLATITPSIFIILLGVSVVVKRIVFTAAAGWTLFVLFFVSVAMLAVGVPKIVFSFKEQGEYKIENTYHVAGKAAVLKINEVGMDDYHATRLTLKGYEGRDLKLIQNYKSQGSTRAKAIENAKMVDYYVDFKDDSVLTFDSNVRFKPDAIFRAQRLDMTLFIPYNFPFRMDEGISRFITQYVDCCGMAGTDNMDRFSWKITENDGLECIDCPRSEDDNDDERTSSSLTDFNEVEITGKFDVKLSQGNDYSVELLGPEKENYNLYRSGETLVIEYRGKKKFNLDVKDLNIEQMRINITMPNLEKLEATGFGTIRIEDFTTDEMEIESRGPVRLKGKLNAQSLTVNLTGKSEAEFSGNANKLNARLEFASKLRAYNLDVVDATVEVSGASTAKVNVSGNLDIEEGMASSVDYRGNPNVVKRD
jgi:phage shock protein PspC (stress-responsive transcriptional regulator)